METETLLLTIGAVVMAIGAVSFGLLGSRAPEGSIPFFIITTTVAALAALAYMAMAMGTGVAVIEEPGGGAREFYFARYLDWIFTTPLLLIDLALLALVNPARNLGLLASMRA